jgi:hypothetical protein
MSIDTDTVNQAIALADALHLRRHAADRLRIATDAVRERLQQGAGADDDEIARALFGLAEVDVMLSTGTCGCATAVKVTIPSAAEIEARRLELREKPMRKFALIGGGKRQTHQEYAAAHDLPDEPGAA